MNLGSMLRVKMRIALAVLIDRRPAYMIRNIATGLVLAALLYAAYVFFYNLIFQYVATLDEIGQVLIDRLVSVGFLAFFVMLVFSSFIAALSTFFKSSETEYLFSTPLESPVMLIGKYVDTVIFSSWAVLVMAFPIFMAYARIQRFGLFDYASSGVLILVPFVIIATSLGSITAIGFTLLSKLISRRRLFILGAGLFVLAVYVFVRFSQPNQLEVPFTEDFRALNIFINNFRMNSHPLTPNFWMIQAIRALTTGETGDFLFYSGTMLTTAFMFFFLLLVIGDTLYFRTWQMSTERAVFRSNTGDGPHHTSLLATTPRTQQQSLLTKDILVFMRDPGQWSQILLLVALLIIYLLNLRLIPADINNERWWTIIAVMNFGFCGFFLATLAVRFVFPVFSLDGKAFWVTASSPLSTSTLFRQKLILSFTGFFIIAETIAVLSGWLLALETMIQLLTFIGIFLMSIALSCIAVGLGAAFPDYNEPNPSKIATTPGGILNILVSLTYIALMMLFFALPTYRYTVYLVSGGDFPIFVIAASTVLATVLNGVAFIVPLRLGAHALASREY